jgi:PLD-like domain
MHDVQIFFPPLANHIINAIHSAKKEIKIAVCWFTHKGIYDALAQKINEGITVELIINYDQLNIHSDGLDFLQLIKKGAKGWGYLDKCILHHKFMVVDETLVAFGSFNWTKSSNRDAVMICSSKTIADSLLSEFEILLKSSKPLQLLKENDIKQILLRQLFQPIQWTLEDARQLVIRSAKIWLVKVDAKNFPSWKSCSDNQHYALPSSKNLSCTHLDDAIVLLTKASQRSMALRFSNRIREGDLLLAVEKSGLPLGVGVVMTDAEYNSEIGIFRMIEWKPTKHQKPLPKFSSGISQWRDSGLRLLSDLLGG